MITYQFQNLGVKRNITFIIIQRIHVFSSNKHNITVNWSMKSLIYYVYHDLNRRFDNKSKGVIISTANILILSYVFSVASCHLFHFCCHTSNNVDHLLKNTHLNFHLRWPPWIPLCYWQFFCLSQHMLWRKILSASTVDTEKMPMVIGARYRMNMKMFHSVVQTT